MDVQLGLIRMMLGGTIRHGEQQACQTPRRLPGYPLGSVKRPACSVSLVGVGWCLWFQVEGFLFVNL